jgi:hypothetical protein
VNPENLVVLGDGLSGGAGDFGMSEELQPYSFAAQAAKRMGTTFTQPVFESPGIGPVIGFADLPVRLPQAMQTTVLKEFPPSGPFHDLSIPGLKLIDALTRRPASPLVHRSDALQTAINLILGLPGLVTSGSQPLPTQIEYAASIRPTLALVALGYHDVVDAAIRADAAWVPDEVSFRMNYASVLMPFRRMGTDIIACTIPDPADTAFFTAVRDAARVVKAGEATIGALFGLRPDDCLTPSWLVELSCRLIRRTPSPLPDGAVVPAATVARISERVASLNRQIRAAAQEHDAVLFDLHAVFDGWKRDGLTAGGRRLTREYLGGIFSLNGVYPGAVGHGAIANALLDTINAACGTSFGGVDLEALAAFDPVANYRLADGPDYTMADFMSGPSIGPDPQPPASGRVEEPPAATTTRLTLPPGRVQELPIDFDASYFGDAFRPAHTREAKDATYGSTPNTLFGGALIAQGHLQGTVRIAFSEPQGDVAHFEVTIGELTGGDTMAVAPQFMKLPAIRNKVSDAPGMISSGDLNLATGDVSNLSVNAMFESSMVLALLSVNPKIPPIVFQFPGRYGSAWARFDQRADGRLDFSFSGITFMPLGAAFDGDPVRVPLPFAGPALKFASIPGVGSALHPHLHISTKPPERVDCGERCPDLPTNTIREYAAFAHNTAFGDVFRLNIPELGGGATGRSHLTGRFLVQFGYPDRDSIPVLISTVMPGGMLVKPPESPLAAAFPGRLTPGLLGHDEVLRFPQAAYQMAGVGWADDPFEFSIGAVNVKTGRFLGPLLYRGFIVQNILLALMQIEPRTPKSSFFFRGPAGFEKDASGQTVLSFYGTYNIPYPEGFKFPQPDLQSAFTAGPSSALDPYLYFQAMDGIAPAPGGKSGGARGVVASNGQRFSYSYAIPGYPSGKPASFEYVNETTGGTFRMESLTWVNFSNGGRDCAPGECEVITFTGIGLWSHDTQRPHVALVQVSTAPSMPYVTIQIDGGLVSNVNTKPAKAVYPIGGDAIA